MQFKEGIEIILSALTKPLPGEEAQRLLAPALRKKTDDLIHQSTDYRLSSVLILLYPGNGNKLNTVFIERPVNNSVHSGQIAFPGGKQEAEDPSLSHTALRETEEEIGIPAREIKILGALTHLFIPASNFLVHPFVGIMDVQPDFNPDPKEVQSVIPVEVSELLEFPVKTTEVKTSYGTLKAPYFSIANHTVWGATAMIVSEFREMIAK